MPWSPGFNGSGLFFVRSFPPCLPDLLFSLLSFKCSPLFCSVSFLFFSTLYSSPFRFSYNLVVFAWCMFVCHMQSPGTEVSGGCEPTHRCSESNPAPLQEQFTLLSAELFLQALPTNHSFYFYIFRIFPLIIVWASAAYSCLSLSTTLAALLSVFASERLWYSLRFWKNSYRKCLTISLRSCFPPLFFLWDCIQCGMEARRWRSDEG